MPSAEFGHGNNFSSLEQLPTLLANIDTAQTLDDTDVPTDRGIGLVDLHNFMQADGTGPWILGNGLPPMTSHEAMEDDVAAIDPQLLEEDAYLEGRVRMHWVREVLASGQFTPDSFLTAQSVAEIEDSLQLARSDTDSADPVLTIESFNEVESLMRAVAYKIRREIIIDRVRAHLLKRPQAAIKLLGNLHLQEMAEGFMGQELLTEIKGASKNIFEAAAEDDQSEIDTATYPRSLQHIAIDYLFEHRSESWACQILASISSAARIPLSDIQLNQILSHKATSILSAWDASLDPKDIASESAA